MSEMVIIRKSVRKHLADKIPELLAEAVAWMKGKYCDVNFENTQYIFSSSYKRSRYFPNKSNSKYTCPSVCISTRAELMLYDKKSLKLKNTKLFVGSEIQMRCALIHELTHHVQHERGIRKGNELDTTMNEIEYLSQNYPEYHNKLYQEKRKFRGIKKGGDS